VAAGGWAKCCATAGRTRRRSKAGVVRTAMAEGLGSTAMQSRQASDPHRYGIRSPRSVGGIRLLRLQNFRCRRCTVRCFSEKIRCYESQGKVRVVPGKRRLFWFADRVETPKTANYPVFFPVIREMRMQRLVCTLMHAPPHWECGHKFSGFPIISSRGRPSCRCR